MQRLPRLPVTQEIAGSNPVGVVGLVAQLVEQRIEAPCVGSSTLSRAIYMNIFWWDSEVAKRSGL